MHVQELRIEKYYSYCRIASEIRIETDHLFDSFASLSNKLYKGYHYMMAEAYDESKKNIATKSIKIKVGACLEH
jgi:hypothetical protein